MTTPGLTIREVVARTGVEAPTLRMWEQRHGFPEPRRLPSGHRRYSEGDVELIRRVVRERESGLELKAAIEGARRSGAPVPTPAEEGSIYAGLLRRRPDMTPYVLPKRVLVDVSHAIEDECGVRASRGVLLASFQRERHYRSAEARWRDLTGPAQGAVVLADFERLREPPGGPVEVPIDRSDPIGREWSVICDGPDFSAMLAAWERPGQDEVEDGERSFEVFWSAAPDLVRDAARVACSIAERRTARLVEPIRKTLSAPVGPGGPDLDVVMSLTNRMVAYVGGAQREERSPGGARASTERGS